MSIFERTKEKGYLELGKNRYGYDTVVGFILKLLMICLPLALASTIISFWIAIIICIILLICSFIFAKIYDSLSFVYCSKDKIKIDKFIETYLKRNAKDYIKVGDSYKVLSATTGRALMMELINEKEFYMIRIKNIDIDLTKI